MSKDLAKKDESAMATVPDYVKEGQRGSENVGADDLIIPRLALIQQLSPQMDKTKPEFNEDAEAGYFVNSLTGEVYPAPINIVPITYRKEYVVFKDRKKGGGFRGTYPTQAAAVEFISGEDDAPDLEITDTAVHFCFIVKSDGSFEEIVVPMTSTKMKISRKLNSLIRMRGTDSFAGTYILGSVAESNDMGTFHNMTVANAGWASEDIYKAAEEVYKNMDKRSADHGTGEEPQKVESSEF